MPGISNVVVFDVDDREHEEAMERIIGRTPLKADSSRGAHLYYRRTSARLLGTLRPFLDVDIKAGAIEVEYAVRAMGSTSGSGAAPAGNAGHGGMKH